MTDSVEEMVAELQAYVALGITQVQVWFDPPSLAGVEAFAPVLERLEQTDTDAQ